MTVSADILIIGGGIVGLTLARELLQQGAENILIIDKEPQLGMHASGRNSGVLHAGIYYPPETLKAKLCLQGNLLLQEYCREKNLPIAQTGKVIVARTEHEIAMVETLHHRARQNGAKVDLIDETELATLEPYALTCKKALYSHYTTMVDNQAILASLQKDLIQSGKARIQFETSFIKSIDDSTIQTNKEPIHYKTLINAAGAFADQVAHAFDAGKSYYLIPFKGIYRKLIKEKSYLVKGNIYPVPDLRNPFLGVHFTRNLHGDVYIGPTAIPAFGRENYGLFQGMNQEAIKILWHQAILFCVNPKFRSVALEEPKKYCSSYFYRDAKKLVKELQKDWIIPTEKVGIRPQLIDVNKKELMMDFLIEKKHHTLHILNAISPAFTSSMAFAKYVVNHYLNRT